MSGNLHIAWSRLLARGLRGSGVRHVVISPGSRSTPLVLGVAAEEGLTLHTIIDERSAAFFALGLARAAGETVALLCTSGTAGAHYFPAVIEASRSGVPLLVITADRPWQAYDCGASQTIDQVKLFGHHVRHHAELGLPDASALPAVMRIAAQSVLATRWPVPGPVHVNARFQKPLEPVDAPGPEPHAAEVQRLLAKGPPWFAPPSPRADFQATQRLINACHRAQRCMLIAGPAWPPLSGAQGLPLHALRRLRGRFVVCAEATSPLRHPQLAAWSCPSFDAIFRARSFLSRWAPEVIIELDTPPVSSAYAAWLAANPSVERYVVSPHGWDDPHGTASGVMTAQPGDVLDQMLQEMGGAWEAPRGDLAWRDAWLDAQRRVDASVEEHLAGPLSEGHAARLVARSVPPGGVLLVGNSGPVRDLDLFGGWPDEGARVRHQRGAAGIDGLIAGAAGAAASGAPTIAFLGDVATLHDLGSLQLAARATSPLVIVVVNNDGGRIFEQLPLARRAEVAAPFERHFITPHGQHFEADAARWGIDYRRPASAGELAEAIARGLSRPAATLVEVVIDPQTSAKQRAELRRKIDARLDGDAMTGARG